MNRCGWLVLAFAVAACSGGGRSGQTMPRLPGDGAENTARPGEPAGADNPWAGRSDLIKTPEAKPPVEVKLPKIARFTLRSGLEVMVVQNRELPVVGMRLALRSGWADEQRDERGLAEFVASTLSKGTRSRSGGQIADAIDFVGGYLGADAGFEATYVYCSVLSKDLDVCLQLMPDVIQNPNFPDKAIDEVRRVMLAEVKGVRDDPEQLAGVHFQNALWGDDNVRGWPVSQATVDRITRADLARWHKTWFKPNNAVLVVAGDVEVAGLRKRLETAFGGWRKGAVPTRKSYEQPVHPGLKVRIVDKPDATQTHIRLGHLGIAHRDDDYYATLVMNYSLGGGGFSSRLMKVIRSEGGKTYSASSAYDTNLTRGAFAANTFTRNAEAGATVKLVLGEMERMRAEGPSESELVDARANLTGRYATRFESAQDVAGALLAAELHGFDADYVRTWALRVGAVSAEDAKRAANDNLDPNHAVIVLVGAAKDLVPQVEAAGWPYEVVPYTGPVAGFEREALAAASKGDTGPEAEKRARALLDAALKAKGGAARVAGLTGILIEGDAKLESPQVPGGKADATVKRVWVRPHQLRLDLALQISQNGQTIQVDVATVINDQSGWVRQAAMGQAQVNELGPAEIKDAHAQLWRDSELILARHAEPGTKIALAGEETVEGTTYTPVVLTSPDGDTTVKLFIHPKTKLLDRMSYVEAGEPAVEVFADYKTVSGLKIAHVRNSRGSQGRFDIAVRRIEVNPKVADGMFAKP